MRTKGKLLFFQQTMQNERKFLFIHVMRVGSKLREMFNIKMIMSPPLRHECLLVRLRDILHCRTLESDFNTIFMSYALT